jgi:NAD(P)-dependent dehydrogenase (short-subunit alcohol dehydrogenase family)
MTGRLNGKTALITGAASGIGLGSVELFVAEGAQVLAADIQDDKGRMLERRFPGRVRYMHCDVSSEADIAAAVGEASMAFGGLDVLFNNAGLCDMMDDIAEIDAARWDWMYALLVRGPMLGIKHAIPVMKARGGGSIINTASVAGLQAGWGPLAYSSAKAAVIHMSRGAAAQLARHRIRVNAICPGVIATPIMGASVGLPRPNADQLVARVAEIGRDAQPIPKAGLPEDIAKAALYLASDDSEFVTGTHLIVDGGLTVGPREGWDPAVPSPLATLFSEPPQPA